jgi:plasmid maintenance system killer protein
LSGFWAITVNGNWRLIFRLAMSLLNSGLYYIYSNQ